MTDNMRIWNNVCETAPDFTKSFARAGGFRGTAINPTYQVQRATETFGPVGIGWGYEIVDEKFVEGGTVNKNRDRSIIHVIRLRLWYMDGEVRGSVEHFGQTTFVGANSHGVYTDEEAPKKTLTDAISKCLSMLGFSADIHTGLYDDHKYVNDVSEARRTGTKSSAQLKRDGVWEMFSAAADAVRTADDYDRFVEEWEKRAETEKWNAAFVGAMRDRFEQVAKDAGFGHDPAADAEAIAAMIETGLNMADNLADLSEAWNSNAHLIKHLPPHELQRVTILKDALKETFQKNLRRTG